MRRTDLITALVSLIFVNLASAAVIVGFDTGGFPGTATDSTWETTYGDGFADSNLDDTAPVFSAVNLSSVSHGGVWRWLGYGNNSTDENSIATTNYITFTITPDTNASFSLDPTNTIEFNTRLFGFTTGDTGGHVIRSSIDGFASNIDVWETTVVANGPTLAASFDFGPGFTNITSPTEFRIYHYNESANTDSPTIGHNNGSLGPTNNLDFVVNGSTALIPEPGTAGFLVLALASLALRRRR